MGLTVLFLFNFCFFLGYLRSLLDKQENSNGLICLLLSILSVVSLISIVICSCIYNYEDWEKYMEVFILLCMLWVAVGVGFHLTFPSKTDLTNEGD